MSKVVAVIGVSLTATTIAWAVYFYQSKSSGLDSLIPKTVKEFEENGHNEGCVVSLFSGLGKLDAINTTDNNKIEGTFFGSGEKDKKNSEGCLVINWNKENYVEGNNQKWRGDFRLLWAVRNKNETSDKGFIMFATASPSQNSKLKWNGNVYALEKKTKEDKWTIQNATKIQDKEVEFKDKFPTPKLKTQAFWGFVSAEDDISKSCADNNCSGTSQKPDSFLQGYWTWKAGEGDLGTQKLGEWTDKLEEWWKNTFGEDKWKMQEVVKDMTGKWIKKVWHVNGIDKPQTPVA